MSSDDEIDIQLHSSQADFGLTDRPKGSPIIISGSELVWNRTQIYISIPSRKQMGLHAQETGRDRECGGFLLGRRGFDQEGAFLLVDTTLQAQETVGKATSLKFTHETWAVLDEQISKIEPRPNIIGWYHTHPGMGVFYSAQDRFIQEHFFAGEQSLGIVLDGGYEKMGIYQWVSGRLVSINWYTLFVEPSEKSISSRQTGGNIDYKA